MRAYNTIEKRDWVPFCKLLTEFSQGKLVELEIAGIDIGDQIEGTWRAFEGISYDPKEDVLYVHTDPEDHAIEQPIDMVAGEEGIAIEILSIRDQDGYVQTITFRQPLMLPESSDPKSP